MKLTWRQGHGEQKKDPEVSLGPTPTSKSKELISQLNNKLN